MQYKVKDMNKENNLIPYELSCKCCDDKQMLLVDKDKAYKLEKINNEIICDKCISKGVSKWHL